MMRPCITCGRPCQGTRCPACDREAARRKPRSPSSVATSSAAHQRLRRAMVAALPLTCHICREPILSAADLHVDHVVPASRGGVEVAPAHAGCNLEKGGRAPLVA